MRSRSDKYFVGLEFSPGEDVLGVHGTILHLRGARTIEIQETEVPLHLYRYHRDVAGADAEHIGAFKGEGRAVRRSTRFPMPEARHRVLVRVQNTPWGHPVRTVTA
jgi:hypothetical protein